MSTVKEGWKWLMNAPKVHYFRGGRSLCRRWMYLGSSFEDNQSGTSPDDCKTCTKELEKEKSNVKA